MANYYFVGTVQDDLLARVIYGEFDCEKQLKILYWRFELPCLSSHLELWLCGHVHIVINIGKFSEKLPIANINSSPINHLVQYLFLQFSRL